MNLKKLKAVAVCLIIIACTAMSGCSLLVSNMGGYISDSNKPDTLPNIETVIPNEKQEEPKVTPEKSEKYDEFKKKAEAIERYSKENYETATTQSALNTESYTVFRKWDDLLNEVYQYLKIQMTSEDFKELETDEIEWIKEKEKSMQEEAELWEGGSAQPLAVNSVAISYTKERCYYLISLVE